jgi:hypothetical protein
MSATPVPVMTASDATIPQRSFEFRPKLQKMICDHTGEINRWARAKELSMLAVE